MSIQRLLPEIALLILLQGLFLTSHAQPKKDSVSGKPAISISDFENFSSYDTVINAVDFKLDSIKSAADSYSMIYNQAKLKYDMESLDHRHRVFEWQLSSSKYIFIVVNIIVLVGLMLSVWQFYLPIYKMNKMIKPNGIAKEVTQTVIADDQNNETQVSTIKLGKDGVEITSPVIGLLILVISIAFFFMYIHYVYPVSEITPPQTGITASPK